MRALERALGDRYATSTSQKQAEHPDRYAPNAGSGYHLREGATETRIGTDANGVPTYYTVKSVDIKSIPGGWINSPDLAPGATMPWTEPAPGEEPGKGKPFTGTNVIETVVPGSVRPLPYVFRTMSQGEFDGAASTGYIKSDGRMNLGADEGTCAADRCTGGFYMVPGENRVVRIRMRPEDGWKRDRDGYVKTPTAIPFSRVDLVSPVLVKTGETVTVADGSGIAPSPAGHARTKDAVTPADGLLLAAVGALAAILLVWPERPLPQ